MRLVRAAATAMKISGDEMISHPARMMFADEGLVIAEIVEPFDQLHIAL